MDKLEIDGIGMTSLRTRIRLIERLKKSGITDDLVLESIKTVPRHMFVDEALSHCAYEDSPLPIGFGQTISQPYIVARMTSALLSGGSLKKVLEVGTGSGYQAAILAKLVEKVYTVERIRALHKRACSTLRKLKVHNVSPVFSDGMLGLEKYAPYDAIIVTAAPEQIPTQLIEQLEIGGRLVVPVGKDSQELKLITRETHGTSQFTLDMVKFVPMLDGIIN